MVGCSEQAVQEPLVAKAYGAPLHKIVDGVSAARVVRNLREELDSQDDASEADTIDPRLGGLEKEDGLMRTTYLIGILLVVLMLCGCLGGGGVDADQLTLTVAVEGSGSVDPTVGSHQYNTGTVVPLQATPADGWKFVEWTGEVADAHKQEAFVEMDKDKTVTAVFQLNVGEQTSHSADGVGFHMRLAPAARFPTRIDDSGEATVDTPFWIAETQVTYELWDAVRVWALDNGYTFADLGREGNAGTIGAAPTIKRNQPVTMMDWRSSIVWTNALSEMLDYSPVYTYQGAVIKNSGDIVACNNAQVESTNGFRLPTSNEWELAARYKGSDSSDGAVTRGGLYWTPGNYASGATADTTNADATQAVAWYWPNAAGQTQDVAQLAANSLGLYDMSGNVWEWCFDSDWGEANLARRGGCSLDLDSAMRLGGLFVPDYINYYQGLRLVRTAE